MNDSNTPVALTLAVLSEGGGEREQWQILSWRCWKLSKLLSITF